MSTSRFRRGNQGLLGHHGVMRTILILIVVIFKRTFGIRQRRGEAYKRSSLQADRHNLGTGWNVLEHNVGTIALLGEVSVWCFEPPEQILTGSL